MARGYNSAGDILKTRDGQDLNRMWSEFQETLRIVNEKRSLIGSLFSHLTTNPSDQVAQSSSGASFELASEYGIPQGARIVPDVVEVGYPMTEHDLRLAYTWRYLRDATAQELEATHNTALTAYKRLMFSKVMTALVTPTPVQPSGLVAPVVGLWNGTDGATPPPYEGDSFSSTHSHYMTSGSTTVDAGDVEILAEQVQHHGYGLAERSERLIILCHPYQGDTIRGFRSGVNGAKYDFIPSNDAPAYLSDLSIIGDVPPSSFEGLKIIGSYGRAWIAEDRMVPAGYLFSVASGGPNSQSNPVAIRQDPRVQYQGLVQIPGNDSAYPLKDSFYVVIAGAGVRLRGAAAVMQITTSPTYTAPVFAA